MNVKGITYLGISKYSEVKNIKGAVHCTNGVYTIKKFKSLGMVPNRANKSKECLAVEVWEEEVNAPEMDVLLPKSLLKESHLIFDF